MSEGGRLKSSRVDETLPIEGKLLHQKHVAGMLYCLFDVALFLSRKTRKLAGKYFARFGDITVQRFGFDEADFCDFLFV